MNAFEGWKFSLNSCRDRSTQWTERKLHKSFISNNENFEKQYEANSKWSEIKLKQIKGKFFTQIQGKRGQIKPKFSDFIILFKSKIYITKSGSNGW